MLRFSCSSAELVLSLRTHPCRPSASFWIVSGSLLLLDLARQKRFKLLSGSQRCLLCSGHMMAAYLHRPQKSTIRQRWFSQGSESEQELRRWSGIAFSQMFLSGVLPPVLSLVQAVLATPSGPMTLRHISSSSCSHQTDYTFSEPKSSQCVRGRGCLLFLGCSVLERQRHATKLQGKLGSGQAG